MARKLGERMKGVLRAVACEGLGEGVPDADLLDRYAGGQEEAFATLVRRHAAMVLGVARRVLGHEQDAEDVCQATFLLLSRKAAAGLRRESVAGWLCTTARLTALNAHKAKTRRTRAEGRAGSRPGTATTPLDQMSGAELVAVLDEELARLPDRYRAPLVLCCLEGLARDTAAQRLGVPLGTLRVQLERARERLRAALARRGIELGVALLAVVVGSAGAARAELVETVMAAVRGSMSPAVVALTRGMTAMMKIRLILIALLAGGLLVAAGVAGVRKGSPAAAARADQEKPRQVQVRGRVLGPDGKPFAGARLYLNYFSNYYRPEKLAHPVRATSGPDGRFSFTFACSELERARSDNPRVQVLAVARGHGLDLANLRADGKEVTLRLVEDAPVVGRVLSLEGRPVAGARVRVLNVIAFPGGARELTAELEAIRNGTRNTTPPVKGWPGPLPAQPATVTAADGTFRLTGLGRDRLADLVVEGPGIGHDRIHVTTRPGKTLVAGDNKVHKTRIYPATFDYLAPPSRPIRGVVRDKATGKPVAGVRILGQTTHETRTDRDGRYELLGYPKSSEYWIMSAPAPGQPYFSANTRFADTPGFAALEADIYLVRGILVRGRVTARESGKPIKGAVVRYFPLLGNPNGRGISDTTTAADGAYAVVALPGPGVLAVMAASGHNRERFMKYRTAHVTVAQLKAFYKDPIQQGHTEQYLWSEGAGMVMQESHHALVLIEPDAKAQSLRRDVVLEPARLLEGSVAGPDGRPLGGVTVQGLVNGGDLFGPEKLSSANFVVGGLHPKRSRLLLFLNKEKGVGLVRKVRGDEKGPLQIRLLRLGALCGRVVDSGGKPIDGLRLGLTGEGSDRVQVTTGKDGRFRAEGLVAGQKYRLRVVNRPGAGAPRLVLYHEVRVESGKDRDLGDLAAREERD